MTSSEDQYGPGLREVAARWESVTFEEVHAAALDLIPSMPGALLDVGAGSGRDARWFAEHGWDVVAVEASQAPDALGRPGVGWTTLVLQLPDDSTGALPLVRSLILNDRKTSTYKLALLRALLKVAESSSGVAQPEGDDHVLLPLGLVALHWLR